MAVYKVIKNEMILAYFKYRCDAEDYIRRELFSDDFDLDEPYIEIENNYLIIPVDIEEL